MSPWNTDSEIKFLSDLGKHSLIQIPRRVLLMEYAKAIRLRREWDKISQKEVEVWLNNRI